MKIMLNHNSAQQRKETSHTLSDALKRRAQLLIKDKSIDASARAVIRYGLETDDPWLSELVRRADAGEPIIDISVLHKEEVSTEEKIARLAEIICRNDDDPIPKSAALLVLMAMLESSTHPKVLANHVKHLAFTRCGELNCYGMVDTQIAALEGELVA
jgi:hypothetical protein